MKDEEKDLKPLYPPPRRKRGVSFSYWATVGLMILVIFVAMKYEGQGKSGPVDSTLDHQGHSAFLDLPPTGRIAHSSRQIDSP